MPRFGLQSLPEELMKFSLNAAVDMLPHNANLHLWHKKQDSACLLCSQNQSLLHVLNNCAVARDLGRYNHRHDAILQEIAAVVEPKLSPPTMLTVDIDDSYNFPLHIIATDLRPDMVWWDDTHRSLCLTVCFESNFEDAAQRKIAKYTDIVDRAKLSGYRTTLITLQIGSRGVPHFPSFKALATAISMSSKELSQLLHRVTTVAIEGSFKIWCSRNRVS